MEFNKNILSIIEDWFVERDGAGTIDLWVTKEDITRQLLIELNKMGYDIVPKIRGMVEAANKKHLEKILPTSKENMPCHLHQKGWQSLPCSGKGCNVRECPRFSL